ncbi:MAG: polyisoprenoid-binding protein [Proteobacteria bacterium]|nr:polyisoprenoid-binding protein [Pseudomonadota bacterium]
MMFKPFLLAAALIATPLLAHAQATTPVNELPAGTYVMDKAHASLVWRVSHFGLANYTARFTDLDAELLLDPQDVTKSKLVAHVNPMSVRTDFPYPEKKDFDGELAKGEGWFNAGKFPEITFTSTRITRTGDKTGVVEGDLTFLGVTRPVALDVTFNGGMAEHPFTKKGVMGFSATAHIKRSDWGMNGYMQFIGDDVSIQIEAEFGQK